MPRKPPGYYLKYLNDRCVDPFRNCLVGLLAEEPLVACLITDAGLYCTQAVADELKIPRMAFRTRSLGATVAYGVLIDLFQRVTSAFLNKVPLFLPLSSKSMKNSLHLNICVFIYRLQSTGAGNYISES